MRQIVDPFVVAAPSGARIRDRLRISDKDAEVLRLVGEHLGRLAGRDLGARCALGRGSKHVGRAERKKALTAESSSRWAGAITRTTADQWERGFKNLFDLRVSLSRAIHTIEARLVVPVGERKSRTRGYATQSERWHKQRRLQALKARLGDVEARIEQGQVSVVRGGRRLAKNRQNLDDAGLTLDQWRDQWDTSRLFLSADGEADKTWGNETIRVHPETGWVEVRLPTPLAHLSNTPGRAPAYRLSCQVSFNHRADEWAAQTASGAVRYDIWHRPERDRWYIDASWQITSDESPTLDQLRQHRVLGVDLNADHLACWVIAPDGNPVGPGHVIPLELDGDSDRRDGQLRAAITQLLDLARNNGCRSVAIENLNFDDARSSGRETMGRGRRGKTFRRTVSHIPTSKFRTRLVGMAHNRGLNIIAVDPAYTSIWAGQHWRAALNESHTKDSSDTPATRHLAAGVVIGRRSLGQRARRRTEKTATHQRMPSGEPSSRPNTNPDTDRNPSPCKDCSHQPPLDNTTQPKQDPLADQASQHRSGTPTTQDSLLPSVKERFRTDMALRACTTSGQI